MKMSKALAPVLLCASLAGCFGPKPDGVDKGKFVIDYIDPTSVKVWITGAGNNSNSNTPCATDVQAVYDAGGVLIGYTDLGHALRDYKVTGNMRTCNPADHTDCKFQTFSTDGDAAQKLGGAKFDLVIKGQNLNGASVIAYENSVTIDSTPRDATFHFGTALPATYANFKVELKASIDLNEMNPKNPGGTKMAGFLTCGAQSGQMDGVAAAASIMSTSAYDEIQKNTAQVRDAAAKQAGKLVSYYDISSGRSVQLDPAKTNWISANRTTIDAKTGRAVLNK